MVSLGAGTFVGCMVICILVGAGVVLAVGLPMARAMRQTNSQYRQQIADFGQMWAVLYEHHQHEVDQSRCREDDMERRMWACLRAVGSDTKGAKTKDLANEMFSAPSPRPQSGLNARPRRRGALTPQQEIAIARRSRIESGLSVRSMDGTDSTTASGDE